MSPELDDTRRALESALAALQSGEEALALQWSEEACRQLRPEPVTPEPRPEGTVEFDPAILDGSIGDIASELATGSHDDILLDLLHAEEAGKTRKGALAAIEARLDEVQGE